MNTTTNTRVPHSRVWRRRLPEGEWEPTTVTCQNLSEGSIPQVVDSLCREFPDSLFQLRPEEPGDSARAQAIKDRNEPAVIARKAINDTLAKMNAGTLPTEPTIEGPFLLTRAGKPTGFHVESASWPELLSALIAVRAAHPQARWDFQGATPDPLYDGADDPMGDGSRTFHQHMQEALPILPKRKLCPTCRGSSYVRGQDCPACGGTGRVSRSSR